MGRRREERKYLDELIAEWSSLGVGFLEETSQGVRMTRHGSAKLGQLLSFPLFQLDPRSRT